MALIYEKTEFKKRNIFYCRKLQNLMFEGFLIQAIFYLFTKDIS